MHKNEHGVEVWCKIGLGLGGLTGTEFVGGARHLGRGVPTTEYRQLTVEWKDQKGTWNVSWSDIPTC